MALEKAESILRKILNYEESLCTLLVPHLFGKVLSVGCGDGKIESLLEKQTTARFTGAEVSRYPATHIPIHLYDGRTLPFADKSFDATLFVYMMHHSEHIDELLLEAIRVTRKKIIIVDHIYRGPVSKFFLTLFDYFSNIFHEMPLPFTFLKIAEWKELFFRLSLCIEDAQVLSSRTVFFKLATSP